MALSRGGLGEAVRTLLLVLVVAVISEVEPGHEEISPTSAQLCPSTCSCLGNVVDCSQRSLTALPAGLPLWTETL